MSVSRLNIRVDDDDNALIEFYKSGSDDTMVKMINESNAFKLKKYTGAALEDVLTINEDGVITFPKNVEFKGDMTTINSETLNFQDQQLQLGLTDTVGLDVSANANLIYSNLHIKSNINYSLDDVLCDKNIDINLDCKLSKILTNVLKIKEKLRDSIYYYHGQFTINYKSEKKSLVRQQIDNYNNRIVHIITKLGDNNNNKSLIILSNDFNSTSDFPVLI